MSVVDNLYTVIDNGRKGLNKGLSTGLTKLDRITGGVQKGVYTTIFGLSGTGKTNLLIYSYIYRILKDNPDKNITIIEYSLEVSAEIIFAKLLSLYIEEVFHKKIPFTELLSKSLILSDERFKYVLEAKSWLKSIEPKLIIFDKGLTAKRLYSSIMPILLEKGKKEKQGDREVYIPNDPEQLILVLVDHMSIVLPENGRTLKQEMDLISQYLLTLRNKYQISPVVLMQQNREASSTERRKMELTEPDQNSVRDSSSIVQDCEILLAIYSPIKDKLKHYRGYNVIGEDGFGDVLKSIIVLKNRYGISDKVIPVAFMGSIGKFEELPAPEEITNIEYYQNINKEINSLKKDETTEEVATQDQKNKVKFTF